MKNKYEYKGVFKPDIIGHLEGSWGLVWDGDSTETRSGTWGSYLKNSLHLINFRYMC